MEINLCTMPLQVLPGNWKGSTENFLILTAQKIERKKAGDFLWDNLQRIGRKVSGSGLSFAGRERQILFTGRSAWLSWTGYAAKTDGSDGKGNRICDQGTQERFLWKKENYTAVWEYWVEYLLAVFFLVSMYL